MRHHQSKLQRANVVAGFDSQANADEAVLELRLAGLRDRRIGYYYQAGEGRMVDLQAGHHRFSAAIIWGLVGAVAGAGAVVLLDRIGAAGPDAIGMAVTVAVCGALFFGTAGGMIGLWTDRPGEEAPAPAEADTPYVIAVEAGTAAGRAWEILHRRGGHELVRHTAPAVYPGHLPA
ncbi:MAG TPA: hypothetical protein VH092_02355 [Urbifossiella sp.]|jgi:hypothetical protein|nr:hypothetical protein [Urbifossiella sp.]